jgi:hypothetical protein
MTMTATTTIRIDHAALPDPLNLKGPDAAARMIELPTTQLAAASVLLASLQLI